MELKKLAPWNWFKKEEEQQTTMVPVQRAGQVRPVSTLDQFHEEIDRMFDSFFRGLGLPSTGFGRELTPLVQGQWLKPTLDIAAGEKEYTVSVELPGVDEKDIQLELSDDTLVIKGEKKHEKEERKRIITEWNAPTVLFRGSCLFPRTRNRKALTLFTNKGS